MGCRSMKGNEWKIGTAQSHGNLHYPSGVKLLNVFMRINIHIFLYSSLLMQTGIRNLDSDGVLFITRPEVVGFRSLIEFPHQPLSRPKPNQRLAARIREKYVTTSSFPWLRTRFPVEKQYTIFTTSEMGLFRAIGVTDLTPESEAHVCHFNTRESQTTKDLFVVYSTVIQCNLDEEVFSLTHQVHRWAWTSDSRSQVSARVQFQTLLSAIDEMELILTFTMNQIFPPLTDIALCPASVGRKKGTDQQFSLSLSDVTLSHVILYQQQSADSRRRVCRHTVEAPGLYKSR
ncbi:hypothetical protein J6590_068333 [Homalodisca vitripennis]|nr:hypothetical protein J6590_068333 [Homalodisca vitripennis]